MKGQGSAIEPGIVYALRVFFAIQLALSLLSLLGRSSLGQESVFAMRISVTALRSVVLTALLLAVMTPVLPRILQGVFLPAIIVIAVVETYTFLMGSLIVTGSGESSIEDAISVRAAQVIMILLVFIL